MKHLSRLLLFCSVLLFAGCEEIPPVINPIMEGENQDVVIPPVDDQEKQVLIEEFTGVTCVNCPAGSIAIEELIDVHEEQLIAVSIHAGSFSTPYPESLYDFRVPEGISLLDYVGQPLGYPTAVVDRKSFEGEVDLHLFRSQWAGFIDVQLESTPTVRIGIGKNYDEETRELNIGVGINVDETITAEDVRISIMILENDIVDVQLTPDGKQADYKHKHVLRTMLTAFDGNQIGEPLEAGGLIEKFYTTTLPEDYQAENCSIVAFVNLGGESQEVLQANRVKIME